MDNIGNVACVVLHGHVARSAVQGLERGPSHTWPLVVVAELVAQAIVKAWRRYNLSGFLRINYGGLVATLTEMLIDRVSEAADVLAWRAVWCIGVVYSVMQVSSSANG